MRKKCNDNLVSLNKMDDAKKNYEEMLGGCESKLGPGHPKLVDCVIEPYAVFLEKLNEPDDALKLYHDFVERAEAAAGDDESKIAKLIGTKLTVASSIQEKHSAFEDARLKEAEGIYKGIIKYYDADEESAEKNKSARSNVLNLLVANLEKQGKSKEAEEIVTSKLVGALKRRLSHGSGMVKPPA